MVRLTVGKPGLTQLRQQGTPAAHDLFLGIDLRSRHSPAVVEAFDRLIEQIRRCDPDRIIEDAYHGSGIGRVYRLIRELEAEVDGA